MSNIRNAVLGWAIALAALATAINWLADALNSNWPTLLAAAGIVALILLIVIFVRHYWVNQRW